MPDSTEKHFYNLAKSFSNAMLTTHGKNGEMHSRPMILAEVDEAGNVWLMSDVHSEKVEEINNDAGVGMVMQASDKWISLSGSAEIVRDQKKVQALFSEAWKVWFPKGAKDPGLALIKVTPLHGEYWDNAGLSKAKYAFRAVKAYVKGERPEMDRDLGGKVNLAGNPMH